MSDASVAITKFKITSGCSSSSISESNEPTLDILEIQREDTSLLIASNGVLSRNSRTRF